ncbi:TIGR00341 family protein [Natrarchaeobaculum aegyptiacum]|uniref:TIGR00341 family protein n=1 Tax=Natrarchaeobaculum aegyptiacum TaxID=745377 RepID=A0A2Z2I015_9EURY|nr:TIGR00341 family protein [Natrarchaeobaculum aegyptiacum]ARS91677.1 TIGR00341 family protein [Natrarchaeobaculum aegyptiacum]
MRYVEVLIPAGSEESVFEVLEEEEIRYVVSESVSDEEYAAAVRFPLPSDAVERVLDRLREVGIGTDASAVVIDAEAIVSEQTDYPRSRSARGAIGGDRISRQELQAKAAGLTPTFPVYATMTLVSAIVATAGLLLDSPAVVVGSMVIAPLIGPALATSVGTVVDDPALQSTGLVYQISGITIAILGAICLASITRLVGLEPAGIDIVAVAELEERVAPNLLALLIALGAGVAGVLSLTRELSEAIVGVMIAAALIPPAAAVGIAVSWGIYGAAVGAMVLVLVNTLSINFAALVTLWAAEYRPANLFAVTTARKQTIAMATLTGLLMVALLVPLVGATLVELEAAQLESDVETDVDAVLADPAFDGVETTAVSVELGDDYPIRSLDQLVIVLSGPEQGPDPALVERLVAAADRHVDEPMTVTVEFVAADHTEIGGEVAAPSHGGT